MGFPGGQGLRRWALRVAALPILAIYGLAVLVGGFIGLFSRARGQARLLGRALPCPSCGTPNELHGRWRCRAPGCGATYHGFVGRCRMCGSSASFFPCRECGVSIPLGGQR